VVIESELTKWNDVLSSNRDSHHQRQHHLRSTTLSAFNLYYRKNELYSDGNTIIASMPRA